MKAAAEEPCGHKLKVHLIMSESVLKDLKCLTLWAQNILKLHSPEVSVKQIDLGYREQFRDIAYNQFYLHLNINTNKHE